MKFALILLVLSCCTIAAAQKTANYDTYCNPRFEYCVSYPVDVLIPQAIAANGDGRKFVSKDNEVEMLVYGTENGLDQTLAGLYAEESKSIPSESRAITYKLKKNNWFVVSGIKSGRVFYRKTIFRNDQFLTFSIEYPPEQRIRFDSITAKIAASFK